MGKRSNFDRIPKDYYRTFDRRAVKALEPFLEPGSTYIEPCAGAGDLCNGLAEIGMVCEAAFDMDPASDNIMRDNALETDLFDMIAADYIITNPPWTRNILHAMIDRFATHRPTWLLFDADWPYTTQKGMPRRGLKTTAELMSMCTDIVPVGRLRWIPDTMTSGKDNCAWYRFEKRPAPTPTIFHG